MSKTAFVLIECEYDDGCPFNDPYGPSETTKVFSVCSSEQKADNACKAQARQNFKRYGNCASIDKITKGYSFNTDNGWISYSYKEFELNKV